MINDMNTPLDPFVYNNSYYPTDLAASQYYYQSGGSSGNAEQIQQIIMMYSELKGVAPEEIVEELKSLSEEEISQQLQLMLEEIEDAEYQQQIEQSRKASEEQDVDYDVEEEAGMPYGYDPEEFIERQEMILQNQQQEANDRIAEEEEAEPEPTEAQSYLTDPYKYGGAKKRFISKLKKAMGGMDVVKMPQADFNKNNYGENMLGSFVQGVQNNSKKALINEAAQNVEKTISQNPEMLLAPMAQFGMQMYNPMSTLSANAGAGMDYINSRMPSNQAMMDSFGNAYNQFLNDTGISQAANDQQQTLRYGGGLKRFQNNGEVNVKDMLDDEPIIVTDPNDPRLEEYKLRQKLYEGNIYPPEGVTVFNYKDYNLPAYNIFRVDDEGNLMVSKTLDNERFNRLSPKSRSMYKTHPSIYPDRFYEVISTDDGSWVDYDKKTGLEKFNKDDINRFRLTPEFAKKVYETQPYIYSFKGRTYCDDCSLIGGYNDFSVPLYDKPKPIIYDNISSISKEWGRNWKSTSGRNAPPRPGMSASNAGTMSGPDNFGNYYQVRYKDGNSKIFTPDEYEEFKLSQEYLDHKKVENYLQQQKERKKEERRARIEAAKTPLVNKRYGGDLPKAQSLGNFDPKMFQPSPVTGKYSWEGKSINSLLNNPNITRVPVIKAAPKKEVGNHWVKNVQAPDSFSENVLEFVDPTGYLSYDDAARADSSFKASGRKYPTLNESLDMFGALPAMGKIKYIRALPTGLKKSISYGYFPLQQLINAFDSSKDIIDDNFGDVDIKTVPSKVYPYRQGGSLPKAVNGKEYIRKLWEQQYSGDITDEEKEKLFDDFYNTYSNIFSQSNFQSAGNMFNNVPGLGQNPWGYRSFNNPFLQQYAYNPRWYAQKPGSNKKINIRNLPDWSDADLIKTEQMTNRRGRPTGYRYTLQKPSSVIRTEQPAADPNYVVPKVPDVMLNPATQSSVVTSTNPSNTATSTNSTDSKKTAISNAVAKFKQDISDEIRSLQEQYRKPRKKLNQKSKPGIVNIKPDQSTNTNSTDDLEISDEKLKEFEQIIQNAPQGTTIQTVPKQYGGPSLVPYSNEYMAQQYADYKNFYDDYTRPPSNRTMGDGYDAYDRYMRRNIKDPIESKMIGDMSTTMAWQNAADRRKNRFPQNMYPGFLKSQQKGGQLYLYRNGGLPKFQGPEASELTALKPRTYPDPFKAGVTESNMEYPEETLDVVQTTKPNFLQGVVRAMPYMNFANNMYDRISAENQRNKLRQQATSIEGIASPISDYKGRFSEYGAYQPNLQGFQGMGSARFGGNITDGEYYLSDSEIQDIINMGGEVEFLED